MKKNIKDLDKFNLLRPIILREIEEAILKSYKIYIVDILNKKGYRKTLYSHCYEITEKILKKLATIKYDFEININMNEFEKAINHYLVNLKDDDYLGIFKKEGLNEREIKKRK